MSIACPEMSVAAIKNGTVLDHISAGWALSIIKLLKLAEHKREITVGIYLPSSKLGKKDLIKIEDWELDADEVSKVALLAPDTTVTVIRNFEVVDKFSIQFPTSIEEMIDCSNPQCITQREEVTSRFLVKKTRQRVDLNCHYCSKSASLERLKATLAL